MFKKQIFLGTIKILGALPRILPRGYGPDQNYAERHTHLLIPS